MKSLRGTPILWTQPERPACLVMSSKMTGPLSTNPPAVMGRFWSSYCAGAATPEAMPLFMPGCLGGCWAANVSGKRNRAISPWPAITRICNNVTPLLPAMVVRPSFLDGGRLLESARVAVYRTRCATGSGGHFLGAEMETGADCAYTCAHRAALAWPARDRGAPSTPTSAQTRSTFRPRRSAVGAQWPACFEVPAMYWPAPSFLTTVPSAASPCRAYRLRQSATPAGLKSAAWAGRRACVVPTRWMLSP